MTKERPLSNQDLFKKLREEVALWEGSKYYIAEKELFNIEQFLDDHGASDIKEELKRLYGIPLNEKFWRSFLAYHRLKKAREEIKEEERQQEERRRRYLEAVKAYQEAWNEWIDAWVREERKREWKVIPGKKKEEE
ncbi:MAG: hypothetical protein N2260_09440 [Syntrophobacterales bacterium]|nr:hypothetical protein [Syntrophobacterales bacterium]